MNVFVLNTGRCGSYSFVQACHHITNFTCGHESRIRRIGPDRLAYPPNHIEADNRLSWFLGRLDRAYGQDAFYVHLWRDPARTAESFAKRYSRGIIKAYRSEILPDLPPTLDALDVAMDYHDTVTENIRLFLRDKPRKMDFELSSWRESFPRFWSAIEAEGDLDAAMNEWTRPRNTNEEQPGPVGRLTSRWIRRLKERLGASP